jgi:hypothetical protein
MRRILCFAFGLALLLTPGPLYAEQEVTLKSGASLIGQVTLDGDAVVVEIDDARLRVPLQDVAAVAAVDSGHPQQARRLLMTALEAKLLNGAAKEVIGLLAEANRLAPDDPHVAFWYASSLADAGYGKAASEILEREREAITKAYPGMSDQLAARIKRRLELEKLPADVVARIDKLNAEAAHQPVIAETRQMSAVFRLTDHDDRAIEQSAFRVQSNGQDDNLEAFDDGFYVLTFNRSRHQSDEPCRIEVVQPGLEAKTFEFRAASHRVQNAGEFVVRRYEQDAKVPFRVRVVGPDQQPVPGATVTLQATSRFGGVSDETMSATTAADGHAEIRAFPASYYYRVTSEGFNQASGNIELKPESGENAEQQVQLHRAIRATIQVAWRSTGFQGDATSGEATLQASGGPQPGYHPQDPTGWIRPIQIKDRLTLHFFDMQQYGYSGPFGGQNWIRVLESDRETGDAPERDDNRAALAEFKALDLSKLEELKDKLELPNIERQQPAYGRGPIVVPAERGRIYVGKLNHRDMRTGQPVQLAFKVLVEKLSTDSDDSEQAK